MLKRLRDGDDAPALPTPKTRRQLFARALRLRLLSMMPHSFVTFLFFAPALIWTELSLNAISNVDMETAAFAPEKLTGAFLWGLFVLLILTGPAQAGMALLTRNWARGENCYPWSTYFGGMKRNWKQAFFAAVFTGATPLLAYSTLRFYSQMSESASLLFLIPFALSGLFVLFLLLMQQTLWTQLVTYALPFRRILKNAFLLAFLELPRGLLTLLCELLPAGVFVGLTFLFPGRTGFITILGFFYYAFIGLALDRFIAASFANYACEKHINTKIDGARTDIGLETERETDLSESADAQTGE